MWATLSPAVDYWTETDTQWANPLTVRTAGNILLSTTVREKVISQTTTALTYLRPIEVQFSAGFTVGDTLHSVTFDGIAVHADALTADSQSLKGRFTVPEGVPAGTKNVRITASSGHYAEALFTGQGDLLTQVKQQTITSTYYDPLAQTFVLDAAAEICGVDLWFTTKGADQVQVQIREVESGVPGRAIVAQAALQPGGITVGAYTRAAWPPVLLQGGREYAVVLTNDPATALAVADLGAWDEAGGQWVSTRMARQIDAVCTVKKDQLVFLRISSRTSASGQAFAAVHITRASGDQHRYHTAERTSYTGVRAYWHDPDSAQRQSALPGDNEDVKELKDTYASKEDATRAAAAAEKQRVDRGKATLSITLALAQPALMPQSPVTVSGIKDQLDATAWLVKSVEHSLGDGGFTTHLELEEQGAGEVSARVEDRGSVR